MKEQPAFAPYGGENYYGLAAMKPSHYRWRIGTAFSLLGIGTGAQILSTLLDVLGDGGKGDRDLVKLGRYMGLAGSAAAPLLYVLDLHTPQRWFNMLRIFRKSSMMSIGSWTLTGLGAFSALTLLGSVLEEAGLDKGGKWAGTLFGLPASLLAALASVYKGAEIEETNTPLWASVSPLLSVFLASADAAGAASALSLAAGGCPETKKGLDAFAMLAGIMEILVYAQMRRKWKERVSDSPVQGQGLQAGWYVGAVALGVIAPVVIRGLDLLKESEKNKASSAAASIGSLIGSILIPSLLIIAGNRTAGTPQDYFRYTEPRQFRKAARQRPWKAPLPRTPLLLLGAAALGISLLKRR